MVHLREWSTCVNVIVSYMVPPHLSALRKRLVVQKWDVSFVLSWQQA